MPELASVSSAPTLQPRAPATTGSAGLGSSHLACLSVPGCSVGEEQAVGGGWDSRGSRPFPAHTTAPSCVRRANNPKGLLEVREALDKVHRVEDLLPVMKFNSKTRDGFTVNTKVPSLKDPGKEYDGFTITITGDKVGNILFSVETQTTEERTQLYHAEIDALYKDLTTKGKILILSSELGEADVVCNLILSLVYYFYNLMPLSRGSSVIAYSVIMGALMASGKEVSGKIPKGKLVDFEAMTAPGSEAFGKMAKSWMSLKSISPSYRSLPAVAETFPTLRSILEVLNTDSSPRCPKQL
uniref:Tetratricopeptide repeat domain 13 n=1 Tax=Ornithorhynchus anatinus TaxID=9258 RepID=A0A6I8N9A7_ORNAN